MSWLKPYLRPWYARFPGSVPPVKMLAHYIKPLRQAHPEARIVAELVGYLAATPPKYINIPKWAATFGAWSAGTPSVPQPVRVAGCSVHPERPWIAEQNRTKMCRECFERMGQ